MSDGFPISWIRLGEGAPAEPGVYLRASDVGAWLRDVGCDDLAELVEDEAEWPATETFLTTHTRETERS